ncbi:MAG: hypothetical protein M5U19_07235 [Microthrixaceae bacterium]|nr:hypothetical protein [Microthrixaceae bacterium]
MAGFLVRKSDRVADRFMDEMDEQWEIAPIERFPTVGTQLNVVLTAMTISLYRALIHENVPPDHAAELTADIVWHFYALGGRVVHGLAGVRTQEPHRRMVTALRMLLRFPFGSPGRPAYEVEVGDLDGKFLTTWTWCPPQAYVRELIEAQGDRGELAVFRRSWCAFDWAFNDLLAGGSGCYQRPHTMSDGDPYCDMTWQVVDAPRRRVLVEERTGNTSAAE